MTSTETTAGWQLDEAGATAYERHLVPRFFRPFATDLLEGLGLQPGHHLVDVACGTGIVARHAAPQVAPGGRVTAVDVNPAMLSVAHRAASAHGDSIAFEHADASQLPLADASADVVVCQQGLQFFADRSAALTDMVRVLAPGGRLAVSTCRSLDHQPGYRALVETLTRHVGARPAQATASPFALGDPALLQQLMSEAGCVDATVSTRTYQVRFDSPQDLLIAEVSSSPLGALVDRLDPDLRDTLRNDLAAALGPYANDEGRITFPFQILTATATR